MSNCFDDYYRTCMKHGGCFDLTTPGLIIIQTRPTAAAAAAAAVAADAGGGGIR